MGNNIGKIEDCVEVLLALKEEILKAKAEKERPARVTPPCIKFWVGTSDKVHGLLFNNDKQMLGYCDDGEVYEVESTSGFELKRIKEGLPLTPCTYEDLEPGDFCWVIPTFLKGVSSQKFVMMVLPDGKLALADEYGAVRKFSHKTISESWRIGK